MKTSRVKFFLLGGFIGIGLLLGFLYNRPDGLLHIIFCDVGQGDAIYLKMPNGSDMLIDGGPNTRVIECLGRHMPFYDREIDIVVLTHPEKDHYFGLGAVLKRYRIKYFVSVPIANTSDDYKSFLSTLRNSHVQQRYLTTQESIKIGDVGLYTLWPERQWLKDNVTDKTLVSKAIDGIYQSTVAIASETGLNLNIFSLYLHLKYKELDALFTGDGDSQTQQLLSKLSLALPASVEVFKFPHHGSKTGITQEFLSVVSPDLTVIQVGKNSYGHPNSEIVKRLKNYGKVLTTQEAGTIEVVSNGYSWWLKR